MKKIKYEFLQCTKEDGAVVTITKQIMWNEANEEIAKREAYNGEYTIEDDGQPEPETNAQTQEERIAELEEALELLLSGVTE